ncbi:hypothetical protein D3H55_10290 [Bacillus salacetis]|uniref:Uncharacterized protein n=1 Tax=Bacillus salacetis TaxID=2315464 RepID=A0A3A1QYC8_9BACI|nr:hypothetical protein [Bacillus salacetis]RIW33980.1 hypothetical protein D3H55_10290 [Bacillus salacetis]
MTGEVLIYMLFAVLLLFLVPFFIIKGIKEGRSFTDHFTSNGILILLFFVSIGEVLKSFWSEGSMEVFNQVLFTAFIVMGAIPAVILLIWHFPKEMAKWKDPREYRHPAAYKFRHLLMLIMFALIGGAFFMLYQSYKVVF